MAETHDQHALPLPFTYISPPNPNAPVLLAQGAEALVYKTHFLSLANPAVLKVRPTKHYRHPILDRRLTRQRILQEARCLVKLAREGVSVPRVLAIDWEPSSAAGDAGSREGGAWLLMEWIDGAVVRQVVDRWEKWVKSMERGSKSGSDPSSGNPEITQAEDDLRVFLRRIGEVVGFLHKTGVVHGDLTTSNLMLRARRAGKAEGTQHDHTAALSSTDSGRPTLDGEIVLIDLGLASQSAADEDRAVDLYVLERAFGSSHPRTERFFDQLIKGYEGSHKGARSALKRLEDVRMRGRKRSMVG